MSAPFAWEDTLVSAVLNSADGNAASLVRRIPWQALANEDAGRAWRAFESANDLGNPFAVLAKAGFQPNEILAWSEIDRTGSLTAEAERQVLAAYRDRRQRELAADFADRRIDFDQLRAGFVETMAIAGTRTKFHERLNARRFSLTTTPPEPIPRFLINGRGISTAGNLTNLIAQAKAGKTAVLAAKIAAAIVAEFSIKDRDTLGVTAAAPGTMKLLHLDTEQSPYDHDQLVRRALRRAGVESAPEWLWSYGLAGFSATELRQALTELTKQATTAGGIFAILLDGPADMVVDVNDPAESNAFVAQLHNLAIQHHCPIVNVVHENPGQDNGKMRGHFGSQLERKAESNLRLKKSDEITVIFSEKMRKAPIMERDGPRFRWDDAAGMHVSCGSVGSTKDDAKRQRLRDQADAVFIDAGKSALTWSELRNGIAKSEGIGPSGATKRFDAMKSLGVVTRDPLGLWRVAA